MLGWVPNAPDWACRIYHLKSVTENLHAIQNCKATFDILQDKLFFSLYLTGKFCVINNVNLLNIITNSFTNSNMR